MLTNYRRVSLINILREDIFKADSRIKKYEKLMIDAIISFLKEKWSFEAKVIVKKKTSKSMMGDISLTTSSVKKGVFTLHYNPSQSVIQQIKSLIHEMTHVKQVSKKELQPSEDWKSFVWKDTFTLPVKDYIKIMKDFNKYKELPWEEEAYVNMLDASLRQELFKSKQWKSLKGQDPTLDYILDNI